jgi:hypothetical protein
MAPEVAEANRPKRRITRSRLAKPLLTSMGTITMLAASSFVLLAVASTGSANPLNWMRADPAAALRTCGHQGLGAVGCMLSAGFHPAAASGQNGSNRSQQPLMSVATVADQVASDGSSSAQGSRTGSGSTGHSRSGATTGAAHPQHLVNVPPGATTQQVLAACAAAMKTAQTQGAAAMSEVADECETDLEGRCPAVKPSPSPAATAIQELEDECEPPHSPMPSPRPSASPWDE